MNGSSTPESRDFAAAAAPLLDLWTADFQTLQDPTPPDPGPIPTLRGKACLRSTEGERIPYPSTLDTHGAAVADWTKAGYQRRGLADLFDDSVRYAVLSGVYSGHYQICFSALQEALAEIQRLRIKIGEYDHLDSDGLPF